MPCLDRLAGERLARRSAMALGGVGMALLFQSWLWLADVVPGGFDHRSDVGLDSAAPVSIPASERFRTDSTETEQSDAESCPQEAQAPEVTLSKPSGCTPSDEFSVATFDRLLASR